MPVTDEFLRYSCQMQLPGFGSEKQQQLQDARVLMAGAGGLGCPAALYLAAAGVGNITIADFDSVTIGNLHRQVLYTAADVGLLKAEVACKRLHQQNPHITLIPFSKRITSGNVMELVSRFDVIVDGTDNFETRYLLNDACVLAGKPLVYGAIYQYEGQLAVWNVANEDGSRSPHYRDVFPEVDAALIPDCAEGGVIPTLAGLMGCLMANEVIKIITGVGAVLTGKLLLIDSRSLESRIIRTGSQSSVEVLKLEDTFPVPEVAVDEFRKRFDQDQFELIDVRSYEEREVFHIGGRHIPVMELRNHLNTLYTGKPLIFYCASGKRSAEAVRLFLNEFPGASAFSLAGGLKAWKETEVAQTQV